MANTIRKTESLSCRVSPEQKVLIEKAASAHGFNLSDYLLHTLVKAAHKDAKKAQVIGLTKKEWDAFTSAASRPARVPNEATKKAVELFNESAEEDDRRIW